MHTMNDHIYKRIQQSNSFIGEYMRSLDTLETPLAYDFWTAAWVVSTIVGRRTQVARPRIPVFLNLFAILIGESGLARKGASIASATQLVKMMANTNMTRHIGVIDSRITPTSITRYLTELSQEYGYAQLAFSAAELAASIGKDQRVGSVPILLTDLYDCPDDRLLRPSFSKVDVQLRNIYVSFLGASTSSWLRSAVSADIVEGGFTSRCLFILGNKRKRVIAWPDASRSIGDGTITARLCSIDQQADQTAGIDLNVSAREYFVNWYNQRRIYSDSFRASFAGREDSHVLRIAAIMCISDDMWQIQQQHIVDAIALITQVRDDGAVLFEFANKTHMTRHERLILRAKERLIAEGSVGIKYRDFAARLRPFSGVDIQQVLDAMIKLRMVQRFIIPNKTGPSTTILRATTLLTGIAADYAILRELTGEERHY